MKLESKYEVSFDFVTVEGKPAKFEGILFSVHENKFRNYLEKKIKATNIQIIKK